MHQDKPGFFIRRYETSDKSFSAPARAALITDLHDGVYGENQRRLLEAVERAAPQFVLLGGDIFDHKVKARGGRELLRALGRGAPCFYVTGNHEYWTGDISAVKDTVQSLGVRVLDGRGERLNAAGREFFIAGIDDPEQDKLGLCDPARPGWDEQLARVSRDAREHAGAYRVLMSHRPERVKAYENSGFDLVVCGHAHGGQVRLPGINGLYAPNQGLFPRYAGGEYGLSGRTRMIVSRGLARNHPFRVGNPPELVLLDFVPRADRKA